ncbi:MAG TPA: hypothetical protein VHW00_04630 [Thermoanaerobaculia bacterium]|nr:hypothetical protein [Thermoanaerobaculia bacterium]
MDEREFVAAFEACTLPAAEFTHRQHVRLAWLYLRDEPLLTALTRFAEGLKRYATSLGAASKYHETITWAFLFLIRDRMRQEATFEEFAANNEDLFAWQPLLARYYKEETLQSARARAAFVMPDVA